MIIKNKNTIHRSSAAIIGDVAAKLGCDISGSTDDVDLCMVTHCTVSYTHLDVYKRQVLLDHISADDQDTLLKLITQTLDNLKNS